MMKININDRVKVRLTNKGMMVLKNHYGGCTTIISEHQSLQKGVYRFQIWELMYIFGKYIERKHLFKENVLCFSNKDEEK